MKLPIRPQAGQRIPRNWFRDLYDYVAAVTTIRGDSKNIAVAMTDAGQVIRYIGRNEGFSSGGLFSSTSSCICVKIYNSVAGTIPAGSPIAVVGYGEGDESSSPSERAKQPFRAEGLDYASWNNREAKCLAVAAEDVEANGTGKAVISGMALTYMSGQHSYTDMGKIICPVGGLIGNGFAFATAKYQGPTAKIARVFEYDDEKGATWMQVFLGGASGKSSPFTYTGPWGLSLSGSYIYANTGGLIWMPDGVKYAGFVPACEKPNVSSLVVVSWGSSQAVISTLSGDLGSFTEQNPHYWETHAILGKYDAESDSMIQYHFSPIVFMIATEEFVIEP